MAKRPCPIIKTSVGMIDARNVMHIIKYNDGRHRTQIGIESCDDMTLTWDDPKQRDQFIDQVHKTRVEWFHHCCDLEDKDKKRG